jgi:hypothetical protein
MRFALLQIYVEPLALLQQPKNSCSTDDQEYVDWYGFVWHVCYGMKIEELHAA